MIFTRLIALLSVVWIFLACSSSDPSAEEQVVEEINYLTLGDSYTIGEGVSASSRWPNQLVDSLGERNIQIDSLKIIATSGWTTANLQNAIDNTEISGFDLVSLLIGVNNQFQGLSETEFQSEFDELLLQALSFSTGNKVFVVSIPDYGVTPFGQSNSEQIAQELDSYNSYMEMKCIELEVPFVNITEISRDLEDNPQGLAPDNLHPSGFQYSLWVEEMLPVVLELLE